MDKPNPRRWFRFSLRTMFVLVTLGAVFAWFLRSPRLEVIGEIKPNDVAAILKIVPQHSDGTTIPLLRMEKLDFNRVELTGCDENLSRVLVFEKCDGEWIVLMDHLIN